ncbi:MAG: hypothetical protein DCC57_06920 [Chloroflexi bacterium]|nr:MAG: hypothetical protein DCC57_06920 [Chloroflexota bacterium]
MKLYRNLQEIRRKETLGRRLSLTGLLILFIGLLASFVPSWLPPDQPATNSLARFIQLNWTWISFAALPLGFIFASFGSYFINRFARRRWPGSRIIARPDEMLERSMKGFDDKYAYFAWSLPANYVLAGPNGILVFAVRSDKGRVTVQGERWREPFTLGRFFTVFAREGVGNPAFELEEQIRKLRALLNRPAGEVAGNGATGPFANIPIEPVAVFLNPEMQLTLENPVIPVLRPDQVKDFVRRKAREAKLSNATVRELTDYLAQNSRYQQPAPAEAQPAKA